MHKSLKLKSRNGYLHTDRFFIPWIRFSKGKGKRERERERDLEVMGFVVAYSKMTKGGQRERSDNIEK